MKYSGKVRINEESNPGSRSCANRYHRADVNADSGPRVGNAGTMSKRSDFMAAKESRAPLADMIVGAFGARAQDDRINPKLEPVSATSRRRFKK
jgi:hypothetical protein